MTLNLSPEVLSRRVFRQDLLNLHIKEFMLGQTARFLDSEMVAIDIGAAVGMYSFFWAQHCKEVHSFEAVPPVYDQLLLVANQQENVIPHNLAVGATSGKASFFVDDKRLSNSGFTDLVGGQEIVVSTTTVDAQELFNVGFIKVDVEGHELEVLRGAEKTIDQQRPVCMVEVYSKFNQGPVDETFKFFLLKSYSVFFNIRGVGLQKCQGLINCVKTAEDEAMISVHDADFLFVPDELVDGYFS